MKQCFGYIRVSTVKQGDGVSLEAQKESILSFASRNGLVINRWFEEKESAAKRGRPLFDQMIAGLHNGEAGGVIVHKIDRFARNLVDYGKISELMDMGIQVFTTLESLDFQTRGGRLAADVQAVVAADFIRNQRQETIKGLYGRLNQGLYPFAAPIGYLDNGGGKKKTLDPVRAPLIREAFELYASGEYSQLSLLKKLTRRGLRKKNGKPLTPGNFEQLLGNPFYCSLIRIKKAGQTFQGIHQALITIAVFQRAQEVKAGKGLKKETKHNHTYRRLFRCGICDGALVPELQKGRVYYRCHLSDCPTKSAREDSLENAILDCLAHARLTEADMHWLMKRFREWRDVGDKDAAIAGLELEKLKFKEKQERLTDALIDRLIDQDTYRERNEVIGMEQAMIAERLTELKRFDLDEANLRKFLERLRSLVFAYQSADPPQKRSIVKLATSNRTLSGKKLSVEPSKLFQDIQLAASVRSGGPQRGTDRTFETVWGCLEQYQKFSGELNRANDNAVDGVNIIPRGVDGRFMRH